MHIAILEDNPDIVAYMQIALELAGHHVSSHTHATSLLDTLFTASGPRSPLPYDLITIDLLLPEGFSGLNVIERIREGIPPTQLPIIVISGAGPDLLEQARRYSPQEIVLSKPFRMKALLQLIQKEGQER